MSGVGLTGEIVPLNDASFPVFEDIRGKGGFRAVADHAARDAIPGNFKKIGMVVVTQNDLLGWQWDGSAWISFGGTAALAVPVFKNTFYVTSTATPGASVFTTLSAAVAAVTPGTPTIIYAAPETFNEDVHVPVGLHVAISLYEYNGIKGAINGTVTWNVATPDFLAIEGFEIPGGIVQAEAGASNGPATLRIANCFVDGISGALAHAVVGLLASATIDGDCNLSDSTHINGSVLAQNTVISGAITTPSLSMVDGAISNNVTANTCVLIGTEFVGLVTFNIATDLFMDDYSANSARAGLHFTGTGTVHLQSGVSLEQHDAGTGGATPSIDWHLHSSYVFTLGQDTTPVFAPPLYSQILSLLLIQGGGEHFAWNWPGNTVNPPQINGVGNTELLILYVKEVDKYYPFVQGNSVAQFSIPFGGATPTFDFSKHSSIVFGLDQDVFAPVFTAPETSRFLTLQLLNGGGGPYKIRWPANVLNSIGDDLLPLDQNFFTLFYSKEADTYQLFGETTRNLIDVSKATDAPGHVSQETVNNLLALSGPRSKGTSVTAAAVFDPAAPITGTLINNVPEDGMVYQVNANMWVNATLTSGGVLFNVLWTDANGRARNKLVTGVSLAIIDDESGEQTICPLINTAITYEIVVGNPLVGAATAQIGFGFSVMRLSDGVSVP